jgi:protein-S-isoprenylcysteine O-methyltransferase Ste14
MPTWHFDDRPNRFPWPPVLLLLAIIIGFVLHHIWPLGVAQMLLLQIAGSLLIGCALALDVWASLTFRRAQTTILPHRGSKALVSTGPFAYSRNPIYLGNAVILGGIGLLAGSLWHIVLIAPLVIAISQLAILREEKHLAARFPEEWRAYSSKVRRWI